MSDSPTSSPVPVHLRWWWLFVLRGVVATAFGTAALLWPGITAPGLVRLFAAWAILDGMASAIVALRGSRREGDELLLATEGLISLGAGVVAIAWPSPTVVVLALLAGAWALLAGALRLMAAARLRRAIRAEWMLALAGLASVVLGLVLLLSPVRDALDLRLLLAAYAVGLGVLTGLGLRLGRRAGSFGVTM